MIVDRSYTKWRYYTDQVISKVYLTLSLIASESDEYIGKTFYPRGTVRQSITMIALISGLSCGAVDRAIKMLDGEELTLIRVNGKLKFIIVNPYEVTCNDKDTYKALRNGEIVRKYYYSKAKYCPNKTLIKSVMLRGYKVETVKKVIDYFLENSNERGDYLFIRANFDRTLKEMLKKSLLSQEDIPKKDTLPGDINEK